MNKMSETKLEKVTLNIGVGTAGEKLANARTLLERLTQSKPVVTKAKERNPTWKIKKGDEIGVKVTLRGQGAGEFLKKALDAVDYRIREGSFDSNGNVSFGVREYISFPGARYDPKLGLMGFDVCVTLAKPGLRVKHRRIGRNKSLRKQVVSKQEAIDFLKKNFNAVVEE